MPAPEIEATQYEDFVSQMHLSVHEEAPLWELPLGATDHTRDGTTHHGPWASSACSWLLVRWLNADLIGVYQLKPDRAVARSLPTSSAREALTAHEAWGDVRDLFLVPTDAGVAEDFGVWGALAE